MHVNVIGPGHFCSHSLLPHWLGTTRLHSPRVQIQQNPSAHDPGMASAFAATTSKSTKGRSQPDLLNSSHLSFLMRRRTERTRQSADARNVQQRLDKGSEVRTKLLF